MTTITRSVARRSHDRNVADGVISATQPHGSHVGVAVLVTHEHNHADKVGDQSEESDSAHDFGLGHTENQNLVNCRTKHPSTHDPEAEAFEQSRRRPGPKRHTDDVGSTLMLRRPSTMRTTYLFRVGQTRITLFRTW